MESSNKSMAAATRAWQQESSDESNDERAVIREQQWESSGSEGSSKNATIVMRVE